jgi:RNA polymerase sigma-70 factor (ECF subfamily)
MCFHSSRFDARQNDQGETVLYDEQDHSLWNDELIKKGAYFLNFASVGERVSRYHLEAGIAYWHTRKEDTLEKWSNILDLYNHLLMLEYSPIAALNRTYALSKTDSKKAAIAEAEKLKLTDNPFYYSLLGNLYTGINNVKAIEHYTKALELTDSEANRSTIRKNIERIK